MAEPSEDVETKVASDAASTFVESYYPALNTSNGRSKLTNYYIKPTATLQTSIIINGNVVATPAELQQMLEKQIEKAHYDVHSFDCSVISTNYNVGLDDSKFGPDKSGKKLSILVVISGTVRHWKEGQEGETRGFTESIVLVPNWDAQSAKAPRDAKRWLIQSQTFRLIS